MPRISVDKELCKGCGLCREACPQKILDPSPDFNSKGYYPMRCAQPEKCTGCAMCARTCPEVAIEVYR